MRGARGFHASELDDLGRQKFQSLYKFMLCSSNMRNYVDNASHIKDLGRSNNSK